MVQTPRNIEDPVRTSGGHSLQEDVMETERSAGWDPPRRNQIPQGGKSRFWTMAGLLLAIAAALYIAWGFVASTPEVDPPGDPDADITE